MTVKELIEYYNINFDHHVGPNGERSGDIVICIDVKGIVNVSSGNFLKIGKKYIILNPNGGTKDMLVCDESGENDYYYRWNRFLRIEKYRQIQIDKIINN